MSNKQKKKEEKTRAVLAMEDLKAKMQPDYMGNLGLNEAYRMGLEDMVQWIDLKENNMNYKEGDSIKWEEFGGTKHEGLIVEMDSNMAVVTCINHPNQKCICDNLRINLNQRER